MEEKCGNLKPCEEIAIRCFLFTIYPIYPIIFLDASESAYSTCIYLQLVTQSGNVTGKIVSVKSRIIPINKSFTITRLELLWNCILSKHVYNDSCDYIEVKDTLCWNDSQISLIWIKYINSDSYIPQKTCIICLTESPLKMMKNAFYFILEDIFVLKTFKFLSGLFGHAGKTAWLER